MAMNRPDRPAALKSIATALIEHYGALPHTVRYAAADSALRLVEDHLDNTEPEPISPTVPPTMPRFIGHV
jgi:hypothetical protein